MSNIKFVSHEEFPEDQYNKEIVYLELNVPHRAAFVRKESKTGGKFWSPVSLGVTKGGAKAYYEAYMQDSAFLDKDIKKFLDERSWLKNKPAQKTTSEFDDSNLPF